MCERTVLCERAEKQTKETELMSVNGNDSETELIATEAVKRLSRDLRNAAKLMGVREARFYVDAYYSIQTFRISNSNQHKKLMEGAEPNELMVWFSANLVTLEKQLQGALDKWSNEQPMGRWARQVVGIGPVISAGLCAHLDIEKAPTPGHIWRFCGLDPTSKWLPKTKRPWCASMKRLCYLMGESFVKVSGNAKDTYGKLYLERKAYEAANNDAGRLAHVAQERLAQPGAKKLDAGLIEILQSGKLPQIALHERAKRWTVKLFLSHWWEEAYRLRYGTVPPAPYPIAHMGHAHKIAPRAESART